MTASNRAISIDGNFLYIEVRCFIYKNGVIEMESVGFFLREEIYDDIRRLVDQIYR